MEYYSAIKRNELSSIGKTWRRDLKCMLLGERNLFEEATYCMIPTLCHAEKWHNYGESKKISGCGVKWVR